MVKIDFRKPLIPAAIITLVLLAVNYIMSMIGYPVAPLYSTITPTSAISTTAATTLIATSPVKALIAWIGGLIPIQQYLGMGLVLSFISAYLILLVGLFLVGNLGLPVAKGKVGRLASIILWGSLVFYLIVVGFVLKAPAVIVGLMVHTLIVAFAASWAADKLDIPML